MMGGSERVTKKEWDVLAERPKTNTEVQRSLNAKSNLRNEQDEGHQVGEFPNRNVHDTNKLTNQPHSKENVFAITVLATRLGDLTRKP